MSEAAMSVVVVTPDRFHNIRRTMRHLRAQTICGRLEIVIVCPEETSLSDARPGELDGFLRVTTVAAGNISNVDVASVPGIYAATAGTVAIIEDHAFPEPSWAEAIISHRRDTWAAVGAIVMNANPRSGLSWANLLIAYGPSTEPCREGETKALPGHNLAFDRAGLLALEPHLRDKIVRGGGLLESLQSNGGRFFQSGAARLAHVNPSRSSSSTSLRFNAGRLYGATRAREGNWGIVKRLAYTVLGPLIPFVRFIRVREEMFGGGKRASLAPRIYPALFYGLVMDGFGQMAGYLSGPGSSHEVLATFEMDRRLHITADEIREIYGEE